MSLPSDDNGMTTSPGKGVGVGVTVGASRVAVGEAVGEAGGVAVLVGGTLVAVEVGVMTGVVVATVAAVVFVGDCSRPTSKVTLHDVVIRNVIIRLINTRRTIEPPYGNQLQL